MSERILLVEDDARLAEMLCEYLGGAGFRVVLASFGVTAMERLAESPYDAVILDLMLPDMDGLDVCRQLRAKSPGDPRIQQFADYWLGAGAPQ